MNNATESVKAHADYITLNDEVIDKDKPLTLFDPQAKWKKTTFTNYVIEPLLEKIFEKFFTENKNNPINPIKVLFYISYLILKTKNFL